MPSAISWMFVPDSEFVIMVASVVLRDYTARMKTLRALAAALTLACLPALTIAADDLSGAHGFDFEFGDWTVHHRLKRATGEWYEMDGTATARPVLNGLGNVEDCL